MRRHIFASCIILLFSFWAIRPLFASGFFPMHDDTQVARVIVMGKALREGQFPVRWVTDLGYGYGYPIFNFYGPLPYYVGGFFYSLGIDALMATKIMFLVGILLAGFFMYIFVESQAGMPAGILSALLYMYAPYHAVQIYVRGAVGEFWALAFLPLLLFGLSSSFRKNFYAWFIGGLGLAGTILSHTLLGYTATFFLVTFLFLYWTIQAMRKNIDSSIFVSHILLVTVGLGLSAFFWLPALGEMHLTNVSAQIGSTADFHDHFVCLSQLWDSSWGFGGSVPGCIDGLSFRIGKLLLMLGFASFGLWLFKRKKVSIDFGIITGAIVSLLSFFFMLPISEKLWEIFPFFSYLQYPWRFLTFEILGLSILGGLSLAYIKRLQWLLLFCLIPLIVFIYGKLFVPQYIYNVSSSSFEKLTYLRFDASKISDEYLPPRVQRPQTPTDIVFDTIPRQEGITADIERDTDGYLKAFITAEGDRTVSIKKAFFPGWEYYVNGKKVLPRIEGGLPLISVPAGTNVVELVFANTPIRSIANAISVITIFSLLFIYGKKTIS